MAIKPTNPDATTTVVYIADTAIDVEAMTEDGTELAIMKYAAGAASGLGWRETLKLIDGQTPTEFVIGVIPPAEITAIEDECGLGTDNYKSRMMRWRCFCAAVRDIRGGPTLKRKVGGQWVDDVPKVSKGGSDRVDPEWLDDTFSRGYRQAALFVGGIAWAWNNLSEEDAKNS